MEAAINAGVKRVVVTGTAGALFGGTYIQKLILSTMTLINLLCIANFSFSGNKETNIAGPNDFGDFDLETFDYEKADSTMIVYQASKVLADKRIWKLKQEHPEVDFTISKFSVLLLL